MMKLRFIISLFVAALLASPMALAQKDRVSYVPSIDYKGFLIKQALKSSKKRDRVVDILQDLLREYPKGEERAQLRVRLAQLYLDKARHLYFLELYKNDPDAQKLLKGELSLKRQDLRGLNLNSSYAYNRRAIEIFKEVLTQYPKIKNRDEILFYYAYNLGEIGKTKQALSLYRELITRYPKSRLVPEAYLVQAEYFFYSNKIEPALALYKKVLRYPDSAVRDLATYKVAWCYFNLNDVSRGLRTMESLLSPTKSATSTTLDLRDQARHDIVVMFSFGGFYREAPLYLKQVGGKEHYREMYEHLADLYYRQGKNGYAKVSYERLIKEEPNDKDNPVFQKRLVEVAKRLGRKQDVIIAASKLVKLYSDETGWAAKNRNDWDALQKARDLSESTLKSIALSLHNEAQKTKDEKTYKLAMASYREYLDNFPNTTEANRLRFYYAESLFKLGQIEQAGIFYTKTLETDPKSPFGKQAAYGAIVSYDTIATRMAAKETRKSDSKKGKGEALAKDPEFIPLWEREMGRASDNFVKYFPSDPRAPQIGFKAAKVYYDRNHFKEAIKRFDLVVKKFPKSTAAPFAANLVLDSWNIQQNWPLVVSWGKKYYNNKALPGGKFKRDLFSVIEKASFKVCRSLEEGGKYSEAGDKYLAFVAEFPKSGFIDEALNNAGVSYRKGTKLERSIQVYQKLVKEHPKSPYAQGAFVAIGRGFEDLARYKQAAIYYEGYQKRYPKDKASPGLIFNAAIFRENLGEYKTAIRDYTIYVKSYPREKDAALTQFSIANLFEKTGAWTKAASLYGSLARQYKSDPNLYLQALARRGNASEKAGQRTTAMGVFRQVVASYPRLKNRQLAQDTVELVAESHFKTVNPTYAQFANVRLNVPLDRFGDRIRTKTKYLERLIQQYQKVIDYGSGRWVSVAVFRLGQAYENFAKSLAEVKEPEALDFEAREQFMGQMKVFEGNMQAKAIEAYETCVTKSAELEVFDPIVAQAESRLADLTATSKTKVEEVIHKPVYINDSIGGAVL